jgi:hypothetical protein
MTAVVAAAVLGGCGGGHQRLFTAADARRLANLQPALGGWTWLPNNAKAVWDSSTGSTTDPLLLEFRRKTARLANVGAASKKWQDANKLANLDVAVYTNAADAHASLAPFNALSKGWAARTARVTKAAKARGLGQESWVMRVEGNGAQVTYHWRRGNLVFEAHIHCFGACPTNVDAAAFTWADSIDAAARDLRP